MYVNMKNRLYNLVHFKFEIWLSLLTSNWFFEVHGTPKSVKTSFDLYLIKFKLLYFYLCLYFYITVTFNGKTFFSLTRNGKRAACDPRACRCQLQRLLCELGLDSTPPVSHQSNLITLCCSSQLKVWSVCRVCGRWGGSDGTSDGFGRKSLPE